MDISDVKKLGSLSMVNFAKKHADKLDAHENQEVKARAPLVRQAANNVENAYIAHRPLRALWSSATDAKERGDETVEKEVRGISYDLLAPSLCDKNRKDERYRLLFTSGNIDFIQGSDRAQVAQVRGMVKVLRDNPSHPMSSRAAALEAKNEAFDALLGPQVAAETAFRQAETLLRDNREALYRALRKNLTFLRDVLDENEAAIAKLFPTIAESHVKDDEPPAE